MRNYTRCSVIPRRPQADVGIRSLFPVFHIAHKGMRIAASLALLAMTDSELRSVLLSPVIPRRPQADVGIRSLFPVFHIAHKGLRLAASRRSSQ